MGSRIILLALRLCAALLVTASGGAFAQTRQEVDLLWKLALRRRDHVKELMRFIAAVGIMKGRVDKFL